MPRRKRVAPAGIAYHTMNRAVARLPLFDKPADFDAFERVLAEAQEKHPTRLLAYCVMPNHWHFVIWPAEEGELTRFLRWLTHTHTQRWHAYRGTAGTGHLYQGRFKSFPVQEDGHLLQVIRYVERNALRANLVERAQDWRWSSLWRRERGDSKAKEVLSDWPVDEPADWVRQVNEPETEAELEAMRRSVRRGTPYGADDWRRRIVEQNGLQATVRPPHRPKQARK